MLEILSYDVYGMERAMIASGLPMSTDPSTIVASEKRMKVLGSAKSGSGHDCALKGVTVMFRVKYPLYFTKQFQRYHFADIVSSQSTMHRVTKFDIGSQCNEWVDSDIIRIIQKKVDMYNEMENKKVDKIYKVPVIVGNYVYYHTDYNEALKIQNGEYADGDMEEITKKDLFMQIISNLPSGFEMEMEIVTNYLQLKTILEQRQYHKLPDWHAFCDWIKTLPNFTEFTTKEAK